MVQWMKWKKARVSDANKSVVVGMEYPAKIIEWDKETT
jgi:hypothetical protein